MKFIHLVLTLLTSFVCLLGIYFIWIIQSTSSDHYKLHVVCTTNIVADAIEHIAQDKVHLEMLMGPGVDPHLYKPIEQDITKIAQANIIFYNGLHLEARMADLFEQMSLTKITIAVCQDIPHKFLIRSEEHEEYFDPHVWFNPTLWSYAIETITKTLQTHDPDNKPFYEKNKNIYLDKIKEMYQQTKKEIESIPKERRILITGHDAFEYFAKAYNCKVMSLQGISTASEAGTKDVQNLSNFIFKHKIPAIFIETSIPPRNIQAVQQSVKAKGFDVHIGKELYSDALGTQGTEQGTYIGMINYNIETIVTELK